MQAFGSLGSSVILRGSAFLAPTHPFTFSHSFLPSLAPEPPWVSLGPLGPSWGLKKPWEALQAFGSLGSSVILRGLASLAPPYSPLLLLTPSRPLSLPRPPWIPGTFRGPQEALGAFTSLWQPWLFSQTQGPCFPCSPSLPLAPSCPLSLPIPPGVPGTFLGPQEALGGFASLWQPWLFSQTQGPCFPCSPLLPLAPSRPLLPPEPPWASLGPWDLPGASRSLGSLHKPSAALGLQSDSGALLPLLPLTPPHSLSPPLAP